MANDTCELCGKAIEAGERTHAHHPTARNEGGREVRLVHATCHLRHHSDRGDFARWGRIGGRIMAGSGLWAFNLRNVRTHADYEVARRFPGAKKFTEGE